jgi:glycosyltransferase involved in cell wall biosynthesis
MLWPALRRRVARADVLACVSDAVARQFDGCERTFVVQDGLVRVPEPVGRDEARAALELPPDRFVAAVVGRVSDWKGQDVLARALVEPPLAEIGALGLVAGDSAPGQEQHWEGLTALVEELALGDRLRLLGFRDDLGTVLGAADAVVVPSTHPEALPNSALEAAAAGVPLVATATGGTCEIVREGLTGRLVPPGDASALARALRELADDPAQARRLAAAARVDVCERFRLTRMVDEIQARYDRLCA